MKTINKILILILISISGCYFVLQTYNTSWMNEEKNAKQNLPVNKKIQEGKENSTVDLNSAPTNSDGTLYYKLLRVVKSGKETVCNENEGQFITFKANYVFESDAAGVSVGNGVLALLKETDELKIYEGDSYWGKVSFTFTKDKAKLYIKIGDSRTIIAKNTPPPSGKTTCSFVRESPMPINIPDVSSPNTTTTSSRSIGHKCRVCNGAGNYVHEEWLGSKSTEYKKYCSECRKNVVQGHFHKFCDTCGGDGWVE